MSTYQVNVFKGGASRRYEVDRESALLAAQEAMFTLNKGGETWDWVSVYRKGEGDKVLLLVTIWNEPRVTKITKLPALHTGNKAEEKGTQ